MTTAIATDQAASAPESSTQGDVDVSPTPPTEQFTDASAEEAVPARTAGRGIRPAQASWRALVAICKKCSGRPKRLQSELRKIFKQGGLRDVRVIRTGCLDVCPQGGTCCAVSDALGVRSFVVMNDTEAKDVAAYIAAGRTGENAAVFARE